MSHGSFGMSGMTFAPGPMSLPPGRVPVGPGGGPAVNYSTYLGGDPALDADIVAATMREFSVKENHGGGGGSGHNFAMGSASMAGLSQQPMTVEGSAVVRHYFS